MSDPKMTTLGEALPPECLAKVEAFLNSCLAGDIPEGPDRRVQLRQICLAPHKAELDAVWDLDYLSYAICYAAEQARPGLRML